MISIPDSSSSVPKVDDSRWFQHWSASIRGRGVEEGKGLI